MSEEESNLHRRMSSRYHPNCSFGCYLVSTNGHDMVKGDIEFEGGNIGGD